MLQCGEEKMVKHVIIVGGGMAGLSAATELRDCRVTLVEAKDRFGGRIHTIPTAHGPIELGAEFVHGQSKPLLEAIHSASLTTTKVSDRNQLLESGVLHPVDVWNTFGELTQRIDPRQRDCSFRAFLDDQTIADRDRRMMLAFAEGFNAADATRLSAHALRRAEYASEQIEGATQMRINEGYSALVEALVAKARALGVTLLKNVTVRKIRWRHGHVELDTIQGGNSHTFVASAAIITLPLGVFKAQAVTFDPPLTDKRDAIDGLEFGNVTRITLVFREPWWPDPDFGFIHALDERLPTWWSNPRSAVLTGWAGGPKTDALVQRSAADVSAVAIRTLERIFAKASATIRSQLVSAHFHDWSADPHSRGAYSWIPVSGLFLPKLLAAPVEDTLFFAGEATAYDAQMGTVLGAFESGQRAAREVMAL
jgi:monoamine oxidase